MFWWSESERLQEEICQNIASQSNSSEMTKNHILCCFFAFSYNQK